MRPVKGTNEPVARSKENPSQTLLFYLFASLALIAPCFWQKRIQAGDLSSHIYNAWLAHWIQTGHAPGLAVVPQTTNVLFDLILSALLGPFGAGGAQKIAVSAAVLVFSWGAFAFAAAVSGRRPWWMLPAIAMLAYGWVFHIGFFNFYLSLGLCQWALALIWKPTFKRLAIAAGVLLLAYTAHGLPVAWAAALAVYFWLWRTLPPRRRGTLIIGSMGGIIALRLILSRTTMVRWSVRQISNTVGVDQVWVYDDKYLLAMGGLLLAWLAAFLTLSREVGFRKLAAGVPFQWFFLTGAGILLLPTGIQIPGYRHALVYIADRMSLAGGILLCALLAAALPRRFERGVLVIAATLFFGFLYRDDRVLNALEDRIDAAVAQLPPSQRVIGGIDDFDLHVNAVTHMIDRACLGRCYSYANYEPSTAQFRVRASAPNPFVTSDYIDSFRMQVGDYTVRPGDLPLYQVIPGPSAGDMMVRSLDPGVKSGMTDTRTLPPLF